MIFRTSVLKQLIIGAILLSILAVISIGISYKATTGEHARQLLAIEKISLLPLGTDQAKIVADLVAAKVAYKGPSPDADGTYQTDVTAVVEKPPSSHKLSYLLLVKEYTELICKFDKRKKLEHIELYSYGTGP